MYDGSRSIDTAVLSRNILFVANAIAKVVYELPVPEDIFNGTLGPQVRARAGVVGGRKLRVG